MKTGMTTAAELPLAALTTGLRARKIKGTLEAAQGLLYWRCTVSLGSGERVRRRVPLGLRAEPAALIEAENRVITLAAEIRRVGVLPEPLPWVEPGAASGPAGPGVQRSVALTVAEAAARLEASFWLGKTRSGAAERTWARVATELNRLPPSATLTIELLLAVASTTPAGSRSRQEAVKVFRRLALLIGLDGADRLDALRTSYEPATRELPGEAELTALLQALEPSTAWAWPTWALATYGCRPSEVFSLVPAADNTARVLSVKRKNKLPTWRTALALPLGPAPSARSVPWDVTAPSGYDSIEAQRLVTQWGKWLRRRAPSMQLYDLRHAWAVRSIRRGVPTGLAAKTMGHDIAVHSRTYHRWLDQADVAAFAAATHRIDGGQQAQ